jgi:hypothetical protein
MIEMPAYLPLQQPENGRVKGVSRITPADGENTSLRPGISSAVPKQQRLLTGQDNCRRAAKIIDTG